MQSMKIGLDFDNTIVNYDKIFYDVASKWGVDLKGISISKHAIRHHFLSMGKEEEWTEMQGYVYGACMDSAKLYPGFIDFIYHVKKFGCSVVIISHKTVHPFKGPKYNLHAAAREWIEKNIKIEERPLLNPESIFFEFSKEKKLERIAQLGCDIFIDDLPEIIISPNFPKNVSAILFDPDCNHSSFEIKYPGVRVLSSWFNIQQELKQLWL